MALIRYVIVQHVNNKMVHTPLFATMHPSVRERAGFHCTDLTAGKSPPNKPWKQTKARKKKSLYKISPQQSVLHECPSRFLRHFSWNSVVAFRSASFCLGGLILTSDSVVHLHEMDRSPLSCISAITSPCIRAYYIIGNLAQSTAIEVEERYYYSSIYNEKIIYSDKSVNVKGLVIASRKAIPWESVRCPTEPPIPSLPWRSLPFPTRQRNEPLEKRQRRRFWCSCKNLNRPYAWNRRDTKQNKSGLWENDLSCATTTRWWWWWRKSGRFGFTLWNGFVCAGLGFVWVSRLFRDCDIMEYIIVI